MRKSEITSLTWEGVNLETGWIHLKPENTKTDEPRDIPISPRLKDHLSRLPRSEEFNNVFIFRGKPMDDFKTAWPKARKAAGIEDFWFHDLRRCFITRMRRLGVDNYTVSAITGHKTESAFKCYQAIEKIDLTNAVEKLSRPAPVQREVSENDGCNVST